MIAVLEGDRRGVGSDVDTPIHVAVADGVDAVFVDFQLRDLGFLKPKFVAVRRNAVNPEVAEVRLVALDPNVEPSIRTHPQGAGAYVFPVEGQGRSIGMAGLGISDVLNFLDFHPAVPDIVRCGL